MPRPQAAPRLQPPASSLRTPRSPALGARRLEGVGEEIRVQMDEAPKYLSSSLSRAISSAGSWPSCNSKSRSRTRSLRETSAARGPSSASRCLRMARRIASETEHFERAASSLAARRVSSSRTRLVRCEITYAYLMVGSYVNRSVHRADQGTLSAAGWRPVSLG